MPLSLCKRCSTVPTSQYFCCFVLKFAVDPKICIKFWFHSIFSVMFKWFVYPDHWCLFHWQTFSRRNSEFTLKGMWRDDLYQTTTVHNKVRTVCVILGMCSMTNIVLIDVNRVNQFISWNAMRYKPYETDSSRVIMFRPGVPLLLTWIKWNRSIDK